MTIGRNEPCPCGSGLRCNPAMKWSILLRDPVQRAYFHWNMLDRGFYSRQLARLWKHSSRTQTLVVLSDALRVSATPRAVNRPQCADVITP